MFLVKKIAQFSITFLILLLTINDFCYFKIRIHILHISDIRLSVFVLHLGGWDFQRTLGNDAPKSHCNSMEDGCLALLGYGYTAHLLRWHVDCTSCDVMCSYLPLWCVAMHVSERLWQGGAPNSGKVLGKSPTVERQQDATLLKIAVRHTRHCLSVESQVGCIP